MDKIIFLTRHAEAYHNQTEDWSIPDAELTPLGRRQSAALRKDTEHGLQRHVDLVVSSPLRTYAPLLERLANAGKPMLLVPELQEVNDLPCDTGSSRSELEANPEFADLDFSPLDPSPLPAHWLSAPSWTSKEGLFDPERCTDRARWVRRWLRDETAAEERRIVVVAHGDILRVVSDGYRSDKPWANAEVRAFRFASADDHEAVLVPAPDVDVAAPSSGAAETVVAEGQAEPTSSDAQA
ncbi:hypothetical protein JCM8202v2_002218 [Rhodotorula sphaerocarpa]